MFSYTSLRTVQFLIALHGAYQKYKIKTNKTTLTWFRNISLDLHPLVGGHSLLWFAGVVPVSTVEVVGASQFGEVVGVEAVLARVGHALQVRVERAGVSFARMVASHLACNKNIY